ncbi:uncharacterized protein kmr isoform X2 [Planococcus citri]|uniref:uncharacterized protein kmr isoform X2 n=1 Tax=Planococcus citri TaxID=170843 RepID=UPI0031F997DC
MASFKKNSGGNCVVAQQPIQAIVPRRILSAQSQLRSPTVKRAAFAPVAMQGWLHKQGSEGLMLWKKRWFVLSEYCLFYYKNPEEEKLLGSILLPSYKISPCSAIEGKIFRKKYSFKAEHANMRTYYFAADSREQMVQWMNAMSLATIAQQQSNGSVVDEHKNSHTMAHRFVAAAAGGGGGSSNAAGSGGAGGVGEKNENVNFNFHNNYRSHPDVNELVKSAIPSNGWRLNNVENYVQPLYVNAPPKPRRVTEASDQSAECGLGSGPGVGGEMLSSHSQLGQSQDYAIRNDRVYPAPYVNKTLANVTQSHLNYVERRTPDTYGRSPPIDPRTYAKPVNTSNYNPDYEELYNLSVSCNQSASNVRTLLGPKDQAAAAIAAGQNLPSSVYDTASSSTSSVAKRQLMNRPHSADFLEAELHKDKPKSVLETINAQTIHDYRSGKTLDTYAPPPRPKSSIDIVNSDSFHWSEERYAQNMRKSAQYLVAKNNQPNVPAADTKLPYQSVFCDMSAYASAAGLPSDDTLDKSPSRIYATTSSSRMSQSSYDKRWSDYMTVRNDGQGDFIRSKSARIPREKQSDDDLDTVDDSLIYKRRNSVHARESADRGSHQIQQREESMKRLLEWKQRMLQSPLSRKYSGSSNRGSAQNDLFKNYKPSSTPSSDRPTEPDTSRITEEWSTTATGDISRPEPWEVLADDDTDIAGDTRKLRIKNANDQQNRRYRDRSQDGRSSANSLSKYSSASSDEEELEKVKEARKRVRRSSQITGLPQMQFTKGTGVVETTENSHDDQLERCTGGSGYVVDHNTNTACLSENDDMVCSSKHSDSGYDTLKATEYVHTQMRAKSLGALNGTSKCGGSTSKLNDKEGIYGSRKSLSNKYESPPQNIVQDRIKKFEKSSPEEKDSTMEKLMMKEPLKVSMQAELNHAQVSPIKANCVEGQRNIEAGTLYTPKNCGKLAVKRDINKSKSARDMLLDVNWKNGLADEQNDENGLSSRIQSLKLEPDYERCASVMEVSKNRDDCSTPNDLKMYIDKSPKCDPYEDHYLPMAPAKKVFSAPPGDLFYHTRSNSASSASQILILETLLSEDVENSYVEMTVSNGKIQEGRKLDTRNATDDGCEYDPEKSHYEFLYKATSSNEPLYMEVYSNAKDKNKPAEQSNESSSSRRTILPDILNSSNTLKQSKSDSSDADDEASKELDPLEIPQHPRFSLSDTFRPASYYLGSGIVDRNGLGISFDQPDSSDSDLVSPPPIPTSPPPLDDFDTSLELLPKDKSDDYSGDQHEIKVKDFGDISLSETESYNSKGNGSNYSMKKSPIKKDEHFSDVESSGSFSSNITTLPEPNASNYDLCLDNLKHENGGSYFRKDSEDSVKMFYENLYPTKSTADKLNDSNVSSSQSPTPEIFAAAAAAAAANNSTDNFHDGHLGAPYYYADLLKASEISKDEFEKKKLPENTLNNRRESDVNLNVCKRNDIGKKVNLINEEMMERNKLVSDVKHTAQYFGICDKNIPDDKNIYSSHVFQNKLNKNNYRSKTPEPLSDAINFYARCSKSNISNLEFQQTTRRSRSLEGLLEEPANTTAQTSVHETSSPGSKTEEAKDPPPPLPPAVEIPSGDIWEEDLLWRESLRRSSLRHARSLDNLDKDDKIPKCGRQSADILSTKITRSSCKKISRDVTYVNDCVTAQIRKAKQNPKEYTEDYREVRKIKRYARVNTDVQTADDGVHYERLDPRATLTPPSNYYYGDTRDTSADNMKQHGKHNTQPKTGAQSFLEEGVYPTKPPSFEIDREKLRQWDLMSSAPAGMLSAIQKYPASEVQAYQDRSTIRPTHMSDTTPPGSPASGSDSVIGRDQLPQRNHIQVQHCQTQQLTGSNADFNQYRTGQSKDSVSRSPPITDSHAKKKDCAWNLNVSAGELLGRTHEELVLLLIQLRRQSASVCKAMENCHREIESQARLTELETPKKMEHLPKLEELKKRLVELEKQYEKGKPLVNLVDNMVKLGSLYRAGAPTQGNVTGAPLRDKLEFNHRIQERRMLAEERKEWERISPDHNQLQAKVEELYKLDRELQHESSTLQSLKQDKDLLENALGGLKYKIQGTRGNPSEMERYRRQQMLLERELSHVRSVLARNSKKLEETVTANARLEAELVVLRQKLQWNQRPSQDNMIGAPTVAALESELRRVQMLVGDLQRQRNELSAQVRQLTEKSKTLCQQIRPSPTGIAGAGPVPAKKRATSGWIETDLDNDIVQDLAVDRSSTTVSPNVSQMSVPMYINADDKKNSPDYSCSTLDYRKRCPPSDSSSASMYSCELQYCKPMDISESDDKMKRFYGILPREKPQEIKTVRIVKRESERRQRDRDRSGNIGIPITSSGTKRSSIPEESSADFEQTTLMDEERERDETNDDDILKKHSYISSSDYSSHYKQSKEPLPPPPRSDSIAVLRNILNKNKTDDSKESAEGVDLYRTKCQRGEDGASAGDCENRPDSPQLSPVYQSEAAKQIVQEMVMKSNKNGECNRRLVPKEKRRHHTVSSSKPILPMDTYSGNARARDDVDMERALRPRLNGTPDVVRSTLSRTDPIKYNAETIDSVIGTPGKILIPERYVPETTPELSPEEQDKRFKKAEAIRKMLSESTALAGGDENEHEDDRSQTNKRKSEEEKRQREHILQLNQILAQQVMERSKLVAGASSPNSH